MQYCQIIGYTELRKAVCDRDHTPIFVRAITPTALVQGKRGSSLGSMKPGEIDAPSYRAQRLGTDPIKMRQAFNPLLSLLAASPCFALTNRRSVRSDAARSPTRRARLLRVRIGRRLRKARASMMETAPPPSEGKPLEPGCAPCAGSTPITPIGADPAALAPWRMTSAAQPHAAGRRHRRKQPVERRGGLNWYWSAAFTPSLARAPSAACASHSVASSADEMVSSRR